MPRLLIGLILLRLLLAVAFPDLWKSLDTFVELSTPVSAYTRLKEGIYLFTNLQISPYSGGPCHHSPLLLSLFSLIPEGFRAIFFHAVDIYAALQLGTFVRKMSPAGANPEIVGAFYLFNPFSLLSTLAQSTNQLSVALVCCSLGAAAKQRGILSVSLLGLASVLTFYPSYLIFSLMSIISQFQPGKYSKQVLFTAFLLSIGLFLGLAYVPFQSWDFLDKQFGTILLVRDLTRPNIGLWWYFFIEQFEFFRPFFLGAFQMFILAFPIPLNLRFPKQPVFTIACLVGVLAVFKPYPEASDLGLYLTLLVANKPIFDLLEYKVVEIIGLVYVSVLARTFYYLWIYMGSGNSNFYFAITLVYASVMAILFSDSTWCAIRYGYDGGKSANLTQL